MLTDFDSVLDSESMPGDKDCVWLAIQSNLVLVYQKFLLLRLESTAKTLLHSICQSIRRIRQLQKKTKSE